VNLALYVMSCVGVLTLLVLWSCCVYKFGTYNGWIEALQSGVQPKNGNVGLREGQTIVGVMETTKTLCFYMGLRCCILADAIRPLLCDDRLLLGKHIGKDIFRSLPELEALVGIQDQGLDECLRLLATRFPNGFDGQAPFCR
jgi:hypothetical protein